jgi:ankyrin repeat protein
LGEEGAVSRLIQEKASVEASSEEYGSILHAAVKSDKPSPRIIRQLLDAGAKTEQPDPDGRTPLLSALEMVRLSLAQELLIGKPKANTEVRDSRGRTPLLLAVERAVEKEGHLDSRYLEMAKMLLENGANVNAARAYLGTGLHLAARSCNQQMIDLLLGHGADGKLEDDQRRTPLIVAIENGTNWYGLASVVKQLHRAGGDISHANGAYGSPLHVAAYHGREEVIQLLLDAHADLHASCGKYGSVLQAAAAGSDLVEVVELLLRNEVDVNEVGGQHGTPLHASIYHQHNAVFRLLLKGGAEIDTKDAEGRSPLLLAIELGFENIAIALIEMGAEWGALDVRGQTPLHQAVEKGYSRLVLLLLTDPSRTTARDGLGRTPLLVAIESQQEDILELLIQKGADVNAHGGRYGCALNGALYQSNHRMVKMLEDAQARQVSLPLAKQKTGRRKR